MLLRNGPARLKNIFWTIVLAKIFLPLPLLAKIWEPLAARIVPVLPSFLRGGFGSGLAGKVTYILDPVGLGAAASPAADSGSGAPYVALTVVWLAGAGWLTFRWARRLGASGLKGGTPVEQAESGVRSRVLEALEDTGIPREVISIMPGSALPAVTGLIRRRIVISECMAEGLSPAEMRAVLLHEREHLRRFDPLRTLIKRIAVAAFFYYPPLWAVLRQLDLSCEIACDQAAIRAGVKPSAFAGALARALELGLIPAPAAAGLGIKAGSTMKSRFEQIRQPRRLVTMRRHRFALIGAVTLAVMITAFPLPSCVKESDAPQPPEPPEVAEVPAPPEVPGADDLVSPPALIDEAIVLPEYPRSEKDAGIEGSVMLKAEILKDGSVGEITVVDGVEGHPALEESAIKALRQWRFSPATENGQPVDMTIQIPIAFRLDNHKRANGDTRTGGDTKADETMPQLITGSIVTPEYPEEARDAGVTGRLLVETEVLPDGTTGKITIKEGIAGYPGFDQMAIEAVRQWRFTPGTRDGKPVTCTVMIPVEFSLDDK
jgi:TonB family protein